MPACRFTGVTPCFSTAVRIFVLSGTPDLAGGGDRSTRGVLRFRRSERISLDRDVRRVSRDGHPVSNEVLTLVWLDRNDGRESGVEKPGRDHSLRRLAIRVPRKVGNAVARNRVKRALRESFRHEKHNIRSGIDIVIMVKPFPVSRSAATTMREQFLFLCREAGLTAGASKD